MAGRRHAVVAALAALVALPLWLDAPAARAGGGPLDVLVVYNADVPEALAVAEHYQDARGVSDGQLCGVSGIEPTQTTITWEDLETQLLQPVEACLNALIDPLEIDYLVLVRGLPYLVDLPEDGADPGYTASVSAVLQVLRTESSFGSQLAGRPQRYETLQGVNVPWVANPYAWSDFAGTAEYTVENPSAVLYTSAPALLGDPDWPASFERRALGNGAGPWEFSEQLLIVTRLDGFDYDDAHDLIDRGLAADGAFPEGTMLCMAGADPARAARDPECEYTVRHLDAAGFDATWLSDHDPALSGQAVSAYLTGAANLQGAIAGQTYAPGALAGNLTSFGARPSNFFCSDDGSVCPETEQQTSIARYVRAGATGVHGTVAEPYNSTFPGAGALLLYAQGYNLAESWFFTQPWLYWQNIYLGDPLATPWAERPVIEYQIQGEPAQLSGVIPQDQTVVVRASHPQGIGRIRLYLAGELVAEQVDDANGDRLALDSPELSFVVSAPVGEGLVFFAVAESADTVVSPAGWPIEPMARPRVQGWAAIVLMVLDPLPEGDDDDAADDDDAVDPTGCACVISIDGPGGEPRALAALLVLATGFSLRRRRAERR